MGILYVNPPIADAITINLVVVTVGVITNMKDLTHNVLRAVDS
jgi:hypothetical protein